MDMLLTIRSSRTLSDQFTH